MTIERQAPLYVDAHDLCVWLEDRLGVGSETRAVVTQTLSTAHALLTSIATALAFPDTRHRDVREADAAATRLRVLLRVVRDVGLIATSSHRHAQSRIDKIGRMLGGWRRHLRRRSPSIGKPRGGDTTTTPPTTTPDSTPDRSDA